MVDYGGFKNYWEQWIPVVSFLIIGLLLVNFLASHSFFIPFAWDFINKFS